MLRKFVERRKLLLLIFAACCFSACSRTSTRNEEPFTLTFDSTELSVPAEGGLCRAPYSFTGGRDNIASMEIVCSSPWITEKISDIPGEIIVNVEANQDTTDRVAVLDVNWSGGSEAIYIMQKGGTASDTTVSDDGNVFSVVINQVKESSVIYSVYPLDKQMTYLCLLMEKSSYDMFEDDDARFANDMSYFDQIAAANGITLEELLRQNLKTGNTIGTSVTDLAPDTEYCIYVYGVSQDAERLTEYVSELFTSESVPFMDVDFELNPMVDGNHVVIEVRPSDDTVPYVVDAYSGRDIDRDYLKENYQSYINEVINVYTMFGQSVEDAVKSIARIGPDVIAADLSPNSDYTAFAVSISMSGFLNSEVSTKNFSTGDARPSDNVITIEVVKLEPYYVEYAVYTTNDDQYAITAVDAAQVQGWSDEDIIEGLINGNQIQLANGNVTGSISSLVPGTEYVIFAFGYSGGTVTTGLVKEYFTTPSGDPSSNGVGLLNFKVDRRNPVPMLADYELIINQIQQ